MTLNRSRFGSGDAKIGGSKVLFFKHHARSRFDRWLRDYPRATPIVVFCVALMLVIAAAWSVELSEKRVHLAQQQARVDDIASALERQAASDSAYLVAMSALLANVDNPSPQIFRSYAAQLHGVDDLDGVTGLGSITRFDQSDVAELRSRARPFPDVVVPPAGSPDRWPVYVVSMLRAQAPVRNDKWRTSFSLRGDPKWSAVVGKMRGAPLIATTDAALLPADVGKSDRGFLVMIPVQNLAGRPDIRSVAFISVRTKDFVAAAVGPRMPAAARIELANVTAGRAEPLFLSRADSDTRATPLEKQVHLFDQTWRLLYWPAAGAGLATLTLVILFGGTAFSTLLLAYVLLVQRSTRDLHALLDSQLTQEKERAAFIRELNHRVKNTLANVTSIISLTRHRTDNVQLFADTVLQRVKALAAGHSLLEGGQWAPADLRAIFSTQLSVYERWIERVDLEGPDVNVSPNDALTIGLAVHELTTNAARYGALSSDDGRIVIRWQLADSNWVQVDWQEMGGPQVETPEKLGFGLNLVQRALAHELQRPIEMIFDPAGFRCRFFFQLREPRSFRLRSQPGFQTR